jgi:hypothetical protein
MSRAHVLSDWEIEKRYQKATNKCNEIKIMSELEDCTEDEIREVLKDRGIEPEVKKKIGRPRIEIPQPRQPKKEPVIENEKPYPLPDTISTVILEKLETVSKEIEEAQTRVEKLKEEQKEIIVFLSDYGVNVKT